MGDKQSKLIETFRITGGVTKNPFWLQLFADVFQTEIEVLNFDEGPAYGAMFCAIARRNDLKLFNKWRKTNQVKDVYHPGDSAKCYQALYQRFVCLSNQQKTL